MYRRVLVATVEFCGKPEGVPERERVFAGVPSGSAGGGAKRVSVYVNAFDFRVRRSVAFRAHRADDIDVVARVAQRLAFLPDASVEGD